MLLIKIALKKSILFLSAISIFLSPSPVLAKGDSELNFQNLISKRKNVSEIAWKKNSSVLKKSEPKLGEIKISKGPNTIPWFNEVTKSLTLVSRSFPSFAEPNRVQVIQFNFTDLNWATSLVKSLVSAEVYDQMNQQEGGRLLESGCSFEAKTCQGSKQVTSSDGQVFLFIGVPNVIPPNNDERYKSGMLEAHEYFHSLQKNNISNQDQKPEFWPPRWFLEGSAEWIQNASINYKNFKKYKKYIDQECKSDQSCRTISKERILDYLSQSNRGNGMSQYDSQFAYSLGSKFVEILVAIKGTEPLLKIWQDSGKGIGWEMAFAKVFGEDWNTSYPKIAEAVFRNLN